jgi:hypothetical protein
VFKYAVFDVTGNTARTRSIAVAVAASTVVRRS